MPVLNKPKEEKLAQNVAKGTMTHQEACRDAGYSTDPATVTRKIAQIHIQERVVEIRAIRAKAVQSKLEHEIQSSHAIAMKLERTKEKIIQALWWNAQRCLRGQPVLDSNGVQTGQYTGKPDANGANQALKLLGLETHGMFVEKLEIGSPGDFSRLSDDEFNEKFKEEALAAGLPEDAVAGLLTYQPETDEGEK